MARAGRGQDGGQRAARTGWTRLSAARRWAISLDACRRGAPTGLSVGRPRRTGRRSYCANAAARQNRAMVSCASRTGNGPARRGGATSRSGSARPPRRVRWFMSRSYCCVRSQPRGWAPVHLAVQRQVARECDSGRRDRPPSRRAANRGARPGAAPPPDAGRGRGSVVHKVDLARFGTRDRSAS